MAVKHARFPWELDSYAQETEAYRWIEGKGLAPKFLGHLSEESRVIDFRARVGGLPDLPIVRNMLAKLHHLGILHGDVNRQNFLIDEDRATILDFESARRCGDPQLLEKEMDSLEKELSDQSGRGLGGCVKASMRDGMICLE